MKDKDYSIDGAPESGPVRRVAAKIGKTILANMAKSNAAIAHDYRMAELEIEALNREYTEIESILSSTHNDVHVNFIEAATIRERNVA